GTPPGGRSDRGRRGCRWIGSGHGGGSDGAGRVGVGKQLDAGQRAMVVAFATDSHLIAVGLGPAGAVKTTTMHAYQHVLAAHGQRLIPLATSAAAAAVLAADLGVPAENVHKFVYEHLTHGQPQ